MSSWDSDEDISPKKEIVEKKPEIKKSNWDDEEDVSVPIASTPITESVKNIDDKKIKEISIPSNDTDIKKLIDEVQNSNPNNNNEDNDNAEDDSNELNDGNDFMKKKQKKAISAEEYNKILIMMKELIPFTASAQHLYEKASNYFFHLSDIADEKDLLNFNKTIEEIKKEQDAKNNKDNNKNKKKQGLGKAKSKKEQLIEENIARKRQEDCSGHRAILTNTLTEIAHDSHVLTQSRIIEYLRRTDKFIHSRTIILGEYIEMCIKKDMTALLCELTPEWLDYLDNIVKIKNDKLHPQMIEASLTLKQYATQWDMLRKSLYRELKITFKNSNDFIEYQMKNVEGMSPNSLVDIASSHVELYDWQKRLLRLYYHLVNYEHGQNLLIHSTTTSGKTFITLSFLGFLKDKNMKMLYVGPSETLILQSASAIDNMYHSKIRMAICLNAYDQNKIVFDDYDIVLSLPEYVPKLNSSKADRKNNFLFVADEFHSIMENQTYHDLIHHVSNFTDKIAILTATVNNPTEVITELEKLYKRKCTIVGTSIRPVRMRYYTNEFYPIHPWAGSSSLEFAPKGLASQDLIHVYHLVKNNISKDLTLQSFFSQKCKDYSDSTKSKSQEEQVHYYRINLDSCDAFETKFVQFIKENKTIETDMLKKLHDELNNPELKICQPTVENLYQLLGKVSRDGSVVVFTNHPYKIFHDIVELIKKRIALEIPFLDEILNINANFYHDYKKTVTHEYLEFIEKENSGIFEAIRNKNKQKQGHAKSDKGDDDDGHSPEEPDDDMDTTKTTKSTIKTNSKIKQIKEKIDRLARDRVGALESLRRKYHHINDKYHIITDEIKKTPDSIGDEYEPPSFLQFGNFGTMTKKTIYEEIQEKDQLATQGIAHGLGWVPDEMDSMPIPKMLRMLNLFRKKNVNVLIAGRHRLSVGINLPVKTVIIYDPEGIFTPSEIKQMSGRAGRKGMDRMGETIFMTKDRTPSLGYVNNVYLYK